jgi:K+-transporting ATPase KdpF subunit
VLWPRQSLRQALARKGRCEMDYLVAGVCAVLLFFYLIYALLKPERF